MTVEVLLGAVGAAIGAIAAAGMAGKWVWGRELKKQERETEFWRKMALRAIGLTEKAVTVAEKKVDE